MPEFSYQDGTSFTAKSRVDGVLIDPERPPRFYCTPSRDRPASHEKWRHFPYIVTETVERRDAYNAKRKDEDADFARKIWAINRARWMQAWPNGGYSVQCLEYVACDCPVHWDMFATLEEAVACAKTGLARRPQ